MHVEAFEKVHPGQPSTLQCILPRIYSSPGGGSAHWWFYTDITHGLVFDGNICEIKCNTRIQGSAMERLLADKNCWRHRSVRSTNSLIVAAARKFDRMSTGETRNIINTDIFVAFFPIKSSQTKHLFCLKQGKALDSWTGKNKNSNVLV